MAFDKPDMRAAVNSPGGHVMSDGTMMGTSMMKNSMDGMTASLEGKAGDVFDQEFLTQMVTHHQGAVQMAEMAIQSAKHQEIKDLAQKIITDQNKEIGEMQSWQTQWYSK
jgi:uncharacterized protein (DUF305 family)